MQEALFHCILILFYSSDNLPLVFNEVFDMPDFNFTSKNLKQSSSLQFSLFCLNSLSHCKANEPLTCVFLLALWLHMIYELTIHPSGIYFNENYFFSIVNQITQRCPKESSHCFMVTSILKIRFYVYVCLFMRLKFALSYVLIFHQFHAIWLL